MLAAGGANTSGEALPFSPCRPAGTCARATLASPLVGGERLKICSDSAALGVVAKDPSRFGSGCPGRFLVIAMSDVRSLFVAPPEASSYLSCWSSPEGSAQVSAGEGTVPAMELCEDDSVIAAGTSDRIALSAVLRAGRNASTESTTDTTSANATESRAIGERSRKPIRRAPSVLGIRISSSPNTPHGERHSLTWIPHLAH